MIKSGKILVLVGSLIIVVLIIFVFIFRVFPYNETVSQVLSAISLLCYLLGFSMILKKGDKNERKKVKLTSSIIGLILILISGWFKYLHYPLSSVLFTIAILIFVIIFTPINFKEKYQKWKQFTRSPRDAFLLSLFDFITIVIILIAILFKFMHWPGAGPIALGGLTLLAISLFAWNQKFKKEVVFRKKAEDKLNDSLNEITRKKVEIEDKNEELKQQSEELRSQNEEISSQRDQLDIQHKAITDSIEYAQRIQAAVLPPEIYINELIPENFILFNPRDKVSGDFYWVKQISDFIVVVAADCTGHGVPGAILSMLGMSFLNEIVQKREITQANQVLNELRKQTKQALRQTGKKGEAEDGMDISLCVFEAKTKKLQYAGANNPLFLIQNDEFKEIKADRMPIGYYPNEKPTFTNHEIQLKDGDIFYLFSDGFSDQFGGKKGFKYKTANFQKILIENHNKPMIIQKQLLEQELKNWMQGHEQTDDILVMGVRV